MIELNEEQRRELSDPETVAINPETQEMYILVRKDVYERMRSVFDEDVLATGELVDRIMAEDDAHDPSLASYQCITREGQR